VLRKTKKKPEIPHKNQKEQKLFFYFLSKLKQELAD